MNVPLPLYEGAKPCIMSGFCCRIAPCVYGELDLERGGCKFLEDQKDGTAKCGKYAEIISLPQEQWEWSPAFGAGCCMPMFNDDRKRILTKKEPPV